MPERIQLRRTRGWRKPDGAVVVARPSKWGNPHTIAECGSAAEATRQFILGIWSDPHREHEIAAIRAELGGHDLACWCPLDQPCHADVLLAIANSASPARVGLDETGDKT